MTMQYPEDLLKATQALTTKVEALARHLSVSQKQARRTRLLTVITLALAVFSILGVATTAVLYQQVQVATEANRTNAVTACQNSNEARKANLTLWMYVLSASAANNPNPTPAQQQQREDFKTWVTALYAPRDCADLSKKVDLPPPPKVTPTS